MKRFVLALSLALATLAWSGMLMTTTPASAQDASANTALKNVTGDWTVQVTGDNFVTGKLHFTQVGDTLVGNGLAPDGKGIVQLTGHFKGGQVSGTFRGPTGETGWITLNFQNDTSMSGEWGYHGAQPNGHIVAQKLVATNF